MPSSQTLMPVQKMLVHTNSIPIRYNKMYNKHCKVQKYLSLIIALAKLIQDKHFRQPYNTI